MAKMYLVRCESRPEYPQLQWVRAESDDEAFTKLRDRGFVPVSVQEVHERLAPGQGQSVVYKRDSDESEAVDFIEKTGNEPEVAASVGEGEASDEPDGGLRAVGWTYVVLGIASLLGGGALLALPLMKELPVVGRGFSSDERLMLFVASGVLLVHGLVVLVLGLKIARRRRWACSLAMVVSAVGLLAVPVGTLVHGLLLVWLWKRRSAAV